MRRIVLAAGFSHFIPEKNLRSRVPFSERRHFSILFFLLMLINFNFSFAQDPTPNAGFENWNFDTCVNTFEVPDNWDQLNCETNILSILTCLKTTDAHSGNFAAKLVTKIVFTDTANGIISTGHLITLPPYGVDGGIPYVSRPDSIFGWFKYSPTPGDSSQIEFQLFDTNRDTIGMALFQSGQTITTYTRFSAPIVYFSAATPDTSLWIISSSNGFNSLPNSTLYIDDIGLAYPSGLNEVRLNDFISITPDPTSDFILIMNERQMSGDLILYDEAGRVIRKFPVTKQSETFSISDLDEGFYFVRFTDSKNNFLAAGKILIQR
ncbi:MAG TPA: T9SS type A sorting domain-containing protein [Chitinophagales bacterium]|nr:T9SS type A sorting domain-containing protein [Chitinophagales bacterium]